MWGATNPNWGATAARVFQSTLPVWGATRPTGLRHKGATTYFNPRSPCGERRRCPAVSERTDSISIHAPRVESDWKFPFPFPVTFHFNPRSPCGERPNNIDNVSRVRNFNPRSPCGERRSGYVFNFPVKNISIHAPRVGSDLNCYKVSVGA